jgi:hypothetical protein
MLLDYPLYSVQFTAIETVVRHELYGVEPEFGFVFPGLDVDMRRFLPLVAEKEKAEAANAENSRHRRSRLLIMMLASRAFQIVAT